MLTRELDELNARQERLKRLRDKTDWLFVTHWQACAVCSQLPRTKILEGQCAVGAQLATDAKQASDRLSTPG